MTGKYENLLKAYTLLEDVTPLKFDCGTLCGALCCQNNGKNGEILGMWLLPHERSLLQALEECDGTQNYSFGKAEDGTETVFCKGSCSRAYRPFACRIYPFYPHITKDADGRTHIRIKADPRAAYSCPIVMKTSYLRPSIEFVARLKYAVRILMRDEETATDLLEMSDFLSDLEIMQERLLGEIAEKQ